MSAYITLYCRDKNATSPYIELMTWSRSSTMFQTLKDFVAYEHTVPFTGDDVREARGIIEGELEGLHKQEQRERETLKLVQDASKSFEDVMNYINEYQATIEEIASTCDELHGALHELDFIKEMIENSEFSEDGATIYIGYEDDPNAKEKENA